jgi:large subunit ribosomal protein L18
MATLSANHKRVIRHCRVRRKVSGTARRPRLTVFRSLKHIYVQAIDDDGGRTLAAASTVSAGVRAHLPRSPKERAAFIGKTIAERLAALGITEAVLDRGGFRYHGRVKSLADGARSAGLRF